MKKRMLLLAGVLTLSALVGCKQTPHEVSETSETSESESEEISNPSYNIIMAAATVPPVLAALECVQNGYETYAWIERGKTYSGIASTSFNNLGFDPNTNLEQGIISTEYGYDTEELIVSKIKELNVTGKEFFYLYTTDYKVLTPLYFAFEAGLTPNQFKIVLIEDGTATYTHFKTQIPNYDDNKANALSIFAQAQSNYKSLKSFVDQYVSGYPYTFGFMGHKNFAYRIQSRTKIEQAFGGETSSLLYQIALGNSPLNQSDIRYSSIDEEVHKLTSSQKDEYLTLMFGDSRSEIEQDLTRTTLSDGVTPVPSKKLVFIGSRVRQSDLGLLTKYSSSDSFGAYSSLTSEYKQLFNNENDYDLVKNYLENADNYEEEWASDSNLIKSIQIAAFNVYCSYIYNLKWTYRLYGDEYDIILKGHPRETMDSVENGWTYTIKVDDVSYTYSTFMFNLIKLFHNSDTEGKFVEPIPYGVAAENIAYLGLNFAIAGLPSSTYTGYSPNVPVLFIMNGSTTYINASNDTNSVGSRYEDGTLNGGDESITFMYYNRGNWYSALAKYFTDLAEKAETTELDDLFTGYALEYISLFESWLKTVTGEEDVSAYKINNFGIVTNE